jgi:hypothetical protein
LKIIPLFKTLRDATVVDACTYFNLVMPVCANIVSKASSFFKTFKSDYENFDEFLEGFDDIRSDVDTYALGFDTCKVMHLEVAK